MIRTSIMLPGNLKTRTLRQAHVRGQSLGQFVREALESRIKNLPAKESDPFWADNAVFTGTSPKDMSKRHDDYLYGDYE